MSVAVIVCAIHLGFLIIHCGMRLVYCRSKCDFIMLWLYLVLATDSRLFESNDLFANGAQHRQAAGTVDLKYIFNNLICSLIKKCGRDKACSPILFPVPILEHSKRLYFPILSSVGSGPCDWDLVKRMQVEIM